MAGFSVPETLTDSTFWTSDLDVFVGLYDFPAANERFRIQVLILRVERSQSSDWQELLIRGRQLWEIRCLQTAISEVGVVLSLEGQN